jgi:hypothetical protein
VSCSRSKWLWNTVAQEGAWPTFGEVNGMVRRFYLNKWIKLLWSKKSPNRSQELFKGYAYCSRLPVLAHPPMTMQLLFCGSAPMQATACE